MIKYIYLDIETLGLNPLKEKVIAVGVWAEGNEMLVDVMFNEDERQLLLEVQNFFLSPIIRKSVMITYNGDAFDVPYLVTRGVVCRVDMSFLLDVMHVDFMWLIQKYMVKSYKLKPKLHDFAEVCGMKYEDKITGKGIPLLYETRLFDEIKKHCASDVSLMMKLADIGEIKQLIKIDLKRRYKYVNLEESESL